MHPPSGPVPEHSNTGGGGGGGGIDCRRHEVSNLSCQGGEYERGFPLSYRGFGGSPPGKIWEIVVPEKRF